MRLDDLTLTQLLDSIGAKTPAPGGGAVAAIVSAIGAALGQMVLRYSHGKKSLAEHDDLHQRSLAALEQLTRSALDCAEADAVAYGRLNELWKLEKDDPRRTVAWPGAVAAAIDAPCRLLHDCVNSLAVLRELSGRTNRMLDSDLAIAAILADAAACSAAWNVRINLSLVDDETKRTALEVEIKSALTDAHRIRDEIERACRAPSES